MKFKNPIFQKFWRFSTSFQLGIPVLIALSCIIVAGTIVESRYDAFTAQKLVYHSWMMVLTMSLLVYNLAIVMVDRMPWKNHHYPFLVVHIGIITMVFGGWVTQKYGVDGSLTLGLKNKSRYVMVSDTDLVVYGTFDGNNYRKLSDQEVDFFKHPPTETKPKIIELPDNQTIKLVKYVRYGRISKKVLVGDSKIDTQLGSSVKIQLTNANVKQVESLTQPSLTKAASQLIGPLWVHLGHADHAKARKNIDKNEVYLNLKSPHEISFALYDKEASAPYHSGTLKLGDLIKTHWMNLEIRLLDLIPQAKEVWDVVAVDRPTPLTSSAVQVEYNGKKEWLLLNDRVLLFNNNQAYLVGYINRKVDIGYDIRLDKFQITRYQGTMKAMQYESHVSVLDEKQAVVNEALIAMNEPMQFAGLYFYQSSFEQDPMTGIPTSSILSVNRDPGRWIKYLGSLMLSLGTVWLFFQRRKRKTAI